MVGVVAVELPHARSAGARRGRQRGGDRPASIFPMVTRVGAAIRPRSSIKRSGTPRPEGSRVVSPRRLRHELDPI